MQFQVPQFIEIEDKIFGPLTAKQFFYILGGGAIIFLLYVFFEFWLLIVLGAPVVALAGALEPVALEQVILYVYVLIDVSLP